MRLSYLLQICRPDEKILYRKLGELDIDEVDMLTVARLASSSRQLALWAVMRSTLPAATNI